MITLLTRVGKPGISPTHVHHTSMYGPVANPTFLMKFAIVSFARYYFVRTLEDREAEILFLP